MKKVAAVLALMLAGSACLLPGDDGGETAPVEPEPVIEATAAFTVGNPALDPEAARWIDENIPRWSVYLGGKGHDLHPGRHPWNSFTSVYYDDPGESDLFAPVILVRKGEENDPSRWIQLSLTQHWMKGDRYFDELIECGTLTMMDLVVVMSELAKYADSYVEPSPIYPLEAATPQALRELRDRSRATCKDESPTKLHAFAGIEEGPYGPPHPPGWGDGPESHTNGPGPMGSVDGNGHPLPSDPTSTRPSISQVPPNPSPPRTAEQNGVGPGDPKPKPSPFDKGHEPRPGEMRETFKCNGEVLYGYRAGCTDLSNTSLAWKWVSQAATWWNISGTGYALEDIRTKIQDVLFRHGTLKQCINRCNWMGRMENALGVMIAIIVTGTPKGLLTIAGATGTGALATSWLADTVKEQCIDQVCEGLK